MKYQYMNVYKDVQSNRVILVAHAINNIGVALSTNKIDILNPPYSEAHIGESLFNSMEYCKSHPSWSEDIKGDINKQLGIKNDRIFFRDHVCVMIRWENENRKFVFTPTLQEKQGYRGIKERQIQIGDNASYEVVGRELLRAINAC